MKTIVAFCLVLLIGCLVANGQPNITNTTQQWEHGVSATIAGGGFSLKPQAAPLWWDNGEGKTLNNPSALRSSYSDAWPFAVTQDGGASNMQYRSVGHRSVTQPHNHSTTYMTGCHDDQGECLGGEVGQNVGLTISDGDRHVTWYVSYYLILDPLWPNVGGNHKFFNWETNPPYNMYTNPFCYDNVSGCTSGYLNGRRAPGCKETWWGSPQSLQELDYNTCGDWLWDSTPSLFGGPVVTGDRGVANPALGWVKMEHILSTEDSPLLFHQILSNNVAMLDTTRDPEGDCRHSSRADNPFGGVTIGGFWRQGMCGGTQDDLNDNACRYYDDVYVDSTYARVILTNASTYESSTILELQPPTSWSDNNIIVTVNQGSLGQDAYLYVFDTENNHNLVGYPITFGDLPPQPNAPANVRVRIVQ